MNINLHMQCVNGHDKIYIKNENTTTNNFDKSMFSCLPLSEYMNQCKDICKT